MESELVLFGRQIALAAGLQHATYEVCECTSLFFLWCVLRCCQYANSTEPCSRMTDDGRIKKNLEEVEAQHR
jgi:hypothetical protein